MKNTLPFEIFLQNLKPTNRTLSFFVDWEKCLKNRDEISIYLNHLNFLLGVESENLHNKITLLFNEYPKAFKALQNASKNLILLAQVREKDSINDLVK